ncbi:MAG: TraB family protein, partial [Myxococcota bacterium]|nr:TraB family protein [Myxococcota bacterium]
ERLEIPISLCDRDVRVTLRRAWSALSLWKKARLVSDFLASGFESAELDEDQLRQMRERDVLSELMEDLGRALPELKQVLIDERDAYLAHRIRETEGQRVVAVVGAGHVEGMRRALEEQREIDLHALETVPPVSTVWRWVGWGVPTLVIGGLVWIGLTKGASVAGESLAFWILANGVPSTIAAAAALAHPATVAAAFFVAPVTSLTPVIGAGTVLAFVQSWVQPPLVSEFESFSDDMASPRAWWRSRLLRVLLVFVLTTIGSLIGTYVGGLEILANVF